jgi:hypothetical protein
MDDMNTNPEMMDETVDAGAEMPAEVEMEAEATDAPAEEEAA